MGFGAVSIYLESVTMMLVVLFAMALQSTFFGPIKYSILPQHLKENELVGGNALFEAATFLAILLGTLYGGALILEADGVHFIGASVLAFAVIGFAASWFVPPAPAQPNDLKLRFNILAETVEVMRFAGARRDVFLAILGVAWFWFIGVVFLSQIPGFAKETLNASQHVANLFPGRLLHRHRRRLGSVQPASEGRRLGDLRPARGRPHLDIQHRPLLRQFERGARRRRTRQRRGVPVPPGELAPDLRPGDDRRLRRSLRGSPRVDHPEPHGGGNPCPHHCGEQHHLRGIHGRGFAHRNRPAVLRLHHSDGLPVRRGRQCPRRHLHLQAPAARHRQAHRAHHLPAVPPDRDQGLGELPEGPEIAS